MVAVIPAECLLSPQPSWQLIITLAAHPGALRTSAALSLPSIDLNICPVLAARYLGGHPVPDGGGPPGRADQ